MCLLNCPQGATQLLLGILRCYQEFSTTSLCPDNELLVPVRAVFSGFQKAHTLSSRIACPVTPKAFDLLLYFVQNPDRVISKDELLKAVWADSFVEEGNLTQNVFLLRKALAQKSEDSGLIVTIPRKGYQFTGGW